MMLDLDRFKQVNDTLGHPVGDQLLKLVAERLRAEIGDAGRIGRLGGDEFMVVLPGETSRVALSKLARATIETLSRKYLIKDSTISIGASVGIAIAPYDAQSSESLISMADMALYAAKSDGRGVHRFYDAQMTDADSERRRMRLDLRNTLATKGIILAYQPFVESETGKILGFEALARWEHPHKGTILPSILFPLAESATLDLQLGDVILSQACHEATKWPQHLRVAVNVSKGQIESGTLVKSIERALDASGLSPSRLEIDIAETTFRDCRDKAEQTATELRRMGARVALDDFGAGDTCLANFKCTAIDKIKLDPSFIVGAADSQRRDAAILRSIAGLAESLGIDTLAEGVESEEDATLAKILGCQSMQGFAFGKPVGPDKIPDLIADNDKRQITERQESRKATRTTLFRAAMLYYKDRDYKVVIRNISQLGASIECSRIFPPDSVVALDIGVGDPVAARVAWSDTHRMGLKFVQPFDMKTMKAIPRTAMPLLH
jgi:diguanylate cyclase (GGDEF)-like protein